MPRKIRIVFSLMLISGVLFYDSAYTHSGRTDANGGHYNRKTGECHYHNSGRSLYEWICTTFSIHLLNRTYYFRRVIFRKDEMLPACNW